MAIKKTKDTTIKLRKFKVRQQENKVFLVNFLVSRLTISGKQAKRFLDTRQVYVNNHCIWMARHQLDYGDRVAVLTKTTKNSIPEFNCLYEDDEILIAEKPAGILSNGKLSLETNLSRLLDISTLKAAHRLDRDTSGCLLCTKNPIANSAILKLFKKHEIQKKYHALVWGNIKASKVAISKPIGGKPAKTLILSIDSNPTASHIIAKTTTGRTHQIRKHLASIHHPVLGDRHHATFCILDERAMKLSRHMLHASSLSFQNPISQKHIRVESPNPPEFQHCMKAYNLA